VSASSTPDGRSVAARRDAVLAERLDGETVLYDRESQHLHLLNQSATVVWDRLDGRAAVDEIADEVASAFGIDRDLAREDVLDVVGRLVQMGLACRHE
jgi:PqqD family protein of HPr-rel-A system